MSAPAATTIINLFGAPSVGKTATRSRVFNLMKTRHLNVEEIMEYAKFLVLTGDTWRLTEAQVYLFAQQYDWQLICQRSGFDFAVSDSPLHLSPFYTRPGDLQTLGPLVDEAYNRFNNVNVMLTRNPEIPFQQRGRTHNETESRDIESRMRTYLRAKKIPFIELQVSDEAPELIVQYALTCVELGQHRIKISGG